MRRENPGIDHSELPRITKKKITETEHIAQNESPVGTGPKENIYGSVFLATIDHLDTGIPDYEKQKKQILELCRKNLVLTAEGVIHSSQDKDLVRETIIGLFKEAATSSVVRELLTKDLKEAVEGITEDAFFRKLTEGYIEPSTLESVLRAHQEVTQLKEEKIRNEVFPRQKEKYKKAIHAFFKENEIPFSEKTLAERLDRIRIKYIDQLTSLQKNNFADYDIQTEEIRIADNPSADKEYVEHFINHELTHAIDGRTFLQTTTEKTTASRPIRGGLEFEQRNPSQTHRILQWLNEGVTEAIAMEIGTDQYEQSPSYPKEIYLIGLLLNKGKQHIDKKLLYQAYFENADKAPKSAALKKLIQTINETYAPHFLNRLDAHVTRYGIDKTIKDFSDGWEKITG